MKKTQPDAVKSQSEFRQRLKAGEIGPLYLFEGRERYLRDIALQELEAATINPGLRDFNRTVISATNGGVEPMLGLARQYPMISTRRLVVVQDFEAVSDERELEMLKSYLSEPASTTVIVFVTDGMDNRRNIATMLRKTCQTVLFSPLDDQQAARWVVDYAARAGCDLDVSTASGLVTTVGVNLTRLVGELEKLINYVRDPSARAGTPTRITRAEIDLLVRYTHEHSNFELTDAIIAGERKRALQLLDRLYTNADESAQSLSLMIVGAIAVNYRRLIIAREMMALNRPNSEIAQAVGLSPYAVTFLNEKARRIDERRLTRGVALTAQTDLALKTSLATPRMLIEVLVCELARR